MQHKSVAAKRDHWISKMVIDMVLIDNYHPWDAHKEYFCPTSVWSLLLLVKAKEICNETEVTYKFAYTVFILK